MEPLDTSPEALKEHIFALEEVKTRALRERNQFESRANNLAQLNSYLMAAVFETVGTKTVTIPKETVEEMRFNARVNTEENPIEETIKLNIVFNL